MELWSRRAGLINRNIRNHLRIVYEPDCASISCQYDHGQPFDAGDRYIVIDAGGGTLYRIVIKLFVVCIYHIILNM